MTDAPGFPLRIVDGLTLPPEYRKAYEEFTQELSKQKPPREKR